MLTLKILQCSLRSRTCYGATNVSLNRLKCVIPQTLHFAIDYGSSSTQLKKTDLSLKTVKSSEIIQEALENKKRQLKVKKQQIKDNIIDKKAKVEEVIERENIFTIPNFLCVGRIALSPYLGYAIIHSNYSVAMGLLVFAGLTDFADGYIARNWKGQASNFGSFLDPLADKTLVATLVVSLTCNNLMPLWLTSIILLRDIFLIGAAFVIRWNSLPKEHRTFKKYFDATHVTAQLAPTFISKINTGVQLFTIAASLGAPVFNYSDHLMLHGLWYLTGITTAVAALSYWTQRKDTYKYLKKSPK